MARNPALNTQLAEPNGSASAVSSGPHRARGSLIATVVAWISRLALLAAVLLVLATSGLDAGQHFLGYRDYTILSGSMSPGMPVGSLALDKPVPTSTLRIGDVITFHPPNRGDLLVTHRVFQIVPHPTDVIGGASAPVLMTKGDANPTPDAWRVPITGVAMKRIANVAFLGYPMQWLQTRSARLLLVGLPIIAFGIVTLVEVWRPRNRPVGPAKPRRPMSRRSRWRLRGLGATISVVGILVSGNSALALFNLADAVPSNAFSTITLVAPTLNTATTQSGGAILLAWSASSSAALHTVSYVALRAPHGSTTFVQVTGSPVSGLTYSDATPSDASYDYVIRTVAGNFNSGNSNTVTGLSDRTAPTISSWALCDQDGIILPVTPDWIKSGGNYIVYANVTDADTSGIASVTATTGIVGGATTSFSLSAASGTCAGTSYAYTSALKTGPTLTGSQTFFADIIATDPATNVTHTDAAQTSSVGVDVVAPAIVTVSHTNGSFLSGLIHLNWTASAETGSGLAGYQINVFSHNTTNHPSQYPSPIVVSGSTLTMNFTIPLLTAFDFTVTPVDNAGNNGPAGSQNNVTGP